MALPSCSQVGRFERGRLNIGLNGKVFYIDPLFFRVATSDFAAPYDGDDHGFSTLNLGLRGPEEGVAHTLGTLHPFFLLPFLTRRISGRTSTFLV
ncbi:MAG: hypothetical protein COU09_02435 [Candidatus Harrisonbacteria bacterium CG10_big_fil_rev_8_21_14_0_10_44_23]|uniref:Uncharacterized protein n=1 Tax=Candidatus Harrisonbacteria bacterium CG10_big_fil_rev_8_21_14_0_10_44_23 TaxID=1974585 RepID=A0A2H0UPP9_9BACT|nr:MAG: hypothetical protein COU09_02435 [Candidatus Harrisonbacteria bacterium CG10_big_fil_rev_8_21_14_0_10_44_23]